MKSYDRRLDKLEATVQPAGVTATTEIWTEDLAQPGVFTCPALPGLDLDREALSRRSAERCGKRHAVSTIVVYTVPWDGGSIPGAVSIPNNGRDTEQP